MKGLFKSPKTLVGAVIAIATIIMMAMKTIDAGTGVMLIGVAATWLGVTAKDYDKTGK